MSTTTITERAKTKIHISASSFIILVSTLYVILFGYTGVTKLITVREFGGAMWKVEFLRPYVKFLMYFIPSLELFIAVLLCATSVTIKKTKIPTRKIGLYLSAILMFSFSVYVGVIIAVYNSHLPCSCGGVMKALSWHQHLYFNISFFVLSVAAIVVVMKHKVSTYY